MRGFSNPYVKEGQVESGQFLGVKLDGPLMTQVQKGESGRAFEPECTVMGRSGR